MLDSIRAGLVGRVQSLLGAGPLAFLAVVLLVTAGAAVYAFSSPSQYTAAALVQFRPRATDNGGVVGNESVAGAAAGYVAYLGAPSTLESVATLTGTRPSALRSGLKVEILPATTTVSVAYTSEAPDLSAQGANALAQIAVARATDDPIVSGAVLAAARVPEDPSGPQRSMLLVAGLLLGTLLAGAGHLLIKAIRTARQQSAPPALSEGASDVDRPEGGNNLTADSVRGQERPGGPAGADESRGRP